MNVIFFFAIIVCTLAFIGFLIYRSKDEETVGVAHPRFSNKNDLQEQFKEAYLWVCEIFGVRENVYTQLEANLERRPSLGVPYFTYYYVSAYSCHYPNMPRVSYEISNWDNKDEQRIFVLEFISLVNSLKLRVDAEDFELFNKYEIPFKNLLTKEFKVDKLSLHQLPE